jgi:glycosyltransferase involved in cell wall biosynthesis
VAQRLSGRHVDLDVMPDLPDALAEADVVVTNETHMASSVSAAEMRARGGPPLVTVCYENIPFRYEDDERLKARKSTVRRWTDAFVALTPEAARALELEGVPASRVHGVTYGVDPARFDRPRDSRLRARWGAAEGDVVVLYTGRLIREKGLVPLLVALSRCSTKHVGIVLVGDGPELPRIRSAADALGMADRVHHAGWVSDRDIPRVLASADVFVLPSLPTPYWEEQLGFSMIEAMAAGLPVVAVASGSIPFILGRGGLTAPPYDLEGLTGTLAQVLGSRSLRDELGSAGRERVADTLNTQRAAEGLAAVLGRLTAAQ